MNEVSQDLVSKTCRVYNAVHVVIGLLLDSDSKGADSFICGDDEKSNVKDDLCMNECIK
jgi:hypothetical protein